MRSDSRNYGLGRSQSNLPGSTDSQQLYPMSQMASLVHYFLTLNSRPQPKPLNLHPIPIYSVQTFVLPNELCVNDNDLEHLQGQVVKASSSRTLLLENGGEFEEIVLDMTVATRSTPVSSARGRHGPLSEESRAAMKLLKDIGACWHCRFTGKKVRRKSTF